MDTTSLESIPVTGLTSGNGPVPQLADALTSSPGRTRPRLSLRHEMKLAIAGTALGILIHVIYIFIMVALPLQSTGAIKLGERFTELW